VYGWVRTRACTATGVHGPVAPSALQLHVPYRPGKREAGDRKQWTRARGQLVPALPSSAEHSTRLHRETTAANEPWASPPVRGTRCSVGRPPACILRVHTRATVTADVAARCGSATASSHRQYGTLCREPGRLPCATGAVDEVWHTGARTCTCSDTWTAVVRHVSTCCIVRTCTPLPSTTSRRVRPLLLQRTLSPCAPNPSATTAVRAF